VHLVGHRSVTFGSAWAQQMEIKRAPIVWVLAVAKVEALKQLEQRWGEHNGPSKGLSPYEANRRCPSQVKSIQYNTVQNIQFGAVCTLLFFPSVWGETESIWYVGHCWPIVPAPDDR
jgi:hypothetical protein